MMRGTISIMSHKVNIPYENLQAVNRSFGEELTDALVNVTDKGWYVLGSEVSCFEKEFAEFVGAKYALGVANGLDALTISLKSCGIGQGDEVIVSANTYIATILAVIHSGATPVLIDAELSTYNINSDLIEGAISNKTKGVLVTHLFGLPCNVRKIVDICDSNNLLLFEDCAQSIGTLVDSDHTGTFGVAGCFSFYPTKTIGALGDAGLIVTNDESVFNIAKSFRNYGSSEKYVFSRVGFNSRLDEIQAAILRVKLRHIKTALSHRRTLGAIYRSSILNKSVLPPDEPWYTNSYHIFPIVTEERDLLKSFLSENGIGSDIHYPIPPYKQEALASNYNQEKFPIADYLHRCELSLPISTATSADDAKLVAGCINKFFKND